MSPVTLLIVHPFFFSFSPCGCSAGGSKSLQCDRTSGICTCKPNTVGVRCNSCENGFFNLQATNQNGCQKCFCYNKTRTCRAAKSNEVSDKVFQSNITQDKTVKLNFQNEQRVITLGNTNEFSVPMLHLHHQKLVLVVMFFTENVTELKNFVKLILMGNNNKVAEFQSSPISSNVNRTITFTVTVQEKYLQKDMTASELQAILADLQKLEIQFIGNNADYVILYSTETKESKSEIFERVEVCDCPNNYTGLSCEQCARGKLVLIFSEDVSSWLNSVQKIVVH